MSIVSGIDVFRGKSTKNADIALGEDWDGPDQTQDSARSSRRKRRGLVSINRSPLARKIITFNLIAIIILVAGVLYLNPFRDSLVLQREQGFVTEAGLIADVFEAQMQASGVADFSNSAQVATTLENLDLPIGIEVFVFDPDQKLVGMTRSQADPDSAKVSSLQKDTRSTLITDFLNAVWESVSGLLAPKSALDSDTIARSMAEELVAPALAGETRVKSGYDDTGEIIFSVAKPIIRNDAPVGAIAVTTAAGEIDYLVRAEREQILQMFVIAILVSIGLSLVLASTIANPLSDLAAAAELGRDRDARKLNPGRIRIPDMTARPDEIGRLSVALRGMVAALYDRIDANEQFAADVAHEIKNPLASLRSAVGSLRIIKKDEQRGKLLDVVEHDVRRLDRLVSDISNASRLDSELIKEEEESFDLLKTVSNIGEYLGQEASKKGVELITDLPSGPIVIYGLEARLAQVFVNLITNAISFCEEGDAIRVWARRRENRILVVVEDTGPGIPDQALHKVFNRFYSERPPDHYGNNSGLGLSISKQIIEAHGGVIWAENIRPTEADITSEPLGARFVVGLPL
ncbi:sensor N-terminal transmembrane domain-containing protein [Profundibacter sp.]|uniref:sensor N-terminal transmembrane domain-containing protein n=1 Tax=Profundibacter sp. TaxID=3101071 RepID=UPI003D14B934